MHCAKVSNDGFVYVCDRTNNRIQVFRKDGTFVTEWFYDKTTLGAGAVWDLNFWPDANQTWLLNIDGENNLLRVLQAAPTAPWSAASAAPAAMPASSIGCTALQSNSKGNVYTGEVDNAKRVQKFKPTSAP